MEMPVWCTPDESAEMHFLLLRKQQNSVLWLHNTEFCCLSGSRESNPGHTVPNRVHYHYATPRVSERRSRRHTCVNSPPPENQSWLLFSGGGEFSANGIGTAVTDRTSEGLQALLTASFCVSEGAGSAYNLRSLVITKRQSLSAGNVTAVTWLTALNN